MSYKPAFVIVTLLLVSYIAYSQNVFNLSQLISGAQQIVGETGTAEQPVNMTISESNPRWNHFPLKVFIDTNSPNFKASYENDAKVAMAEWANSANFISFTEVSSAQNAGIVIRWVSKLKEGSKDTIGNTDLKFLDADRFKIIQSAEIQLLTREGGVELTDMDMTNLAAHEIGHALGLEHNNLKESVMYPKLSLPSTITKQISDSDISALGQIYKLPAKPDLILSEGNATKFSITNLLGSRYFLNTSIAIMNDGISNSKASTLQIIAGNETIKISSLPALEVGSKYIIFLGNLEMGGNYTSLKLVVDPDNIVDELDKNNNQLTINI